MHLFVSQIFVDMEHALVTPAQIGELLVSGRRRAGFTQAEAASRIGVSQSRISVLETDPGAITLVQLLALFGAYGMTLQVQDRLDEGATPRKRPARASKKVEW
jgi:HTH-type transcriptional regulator / antitoxin HipB